jgi:NAD(P)H dehydrogenase (quinone)
MKVLVVFCHPSADSFTAAVRSSVTAALSSNGHETREADLYADGFEPALSRDEHRGHLDDPAGKPDIAPYVDMLRWCEALVLIYPTWWSGQPAMLKGWIDRVFVHGVAFDLPDGATRIRPLLTNIRRLAAVTTHGSSKFVNILEGEAGKRVMTRSIRVLCSRWTRTRWIALYDIDRSTPHARQAFVERAERQLIRFLR